MNTAAIYDRLVFGYYIRYIYSKGPHLVSKLPMVTHFFNLHRAVRKGSERPMGPVKVAAAAAVGHKLICTIKRV